MNKYALARKSWESRRTRNISYWTGDFDKMDRPVVSVFEHNARTFERAGEANDMYIKYTKLASFRAVDLYNVERCKDGFKPRWWLKEEE